MAVKHRDGFTCQTCGARDVRLLADHIIEIDDGGAPLDVTNGMTLCIACHNKKTTQAAQSRRGRLETRMGWSSPRCSAMSASTGGRRSRGSAPGSKAAIEPMRLCAPCVLVNSRTQPEAVPNIQESKQTRVFVAHILKALDSPEVCVRLDPASN